jgi:hypothetical protein
LTNFKKHILFIILIAFSAQSNAQKYFVTFTDKANNEYSISYPEEFLSQRAIDRRLKQNIEIIEQDLPVSTFYLDSLKKMDLTVYWSSKWLNGSIVECSNSLLIDTITRVSFISDAVIIWESSLTASNIKKYIEPETIPKLKSELSDSYGTSYTQTQTINGQYLHQAGYEGKGMLIAVLDNGFNSVDELSSFDHLWQNNQILGAVNFVSPNQSVYSVDATHGMNVLSIMGGFIDGEFKGSAPEASYLLLRTEDPDSEYPIEEYNWVLAAEYADSIGVDVINSSLGYYLFDDASMDYSYEDMDGETTICVQGAEIAFSKGMLIVNSAGNEGYTDWKYIISPADGKNILSVAAMQSDSTRAGFSSYGPSYDGRIKPDIAALGDDTALQATSGISTGDGTSFSAPVITGFISCLWQAKPNLTNTEVLQLVKSQSNQYDDPDDSFGYGIPDFKKAINTSSSSDNMETQIPYHLFPNPFSDYITITNDINILTDCTISIFDISGTIVYRHNFPPQNNIHINKLQYLSAGIYIVQLKEKQYTHTFKLYKQ